MHPMTRGTFTIVARTKPIPRSPYATHPPVCQPLPDQGHGGGEFPPVGEGEVDDGEEDGRERDDDGAEAICLIWLFGCWMI